jgi:hypothetical protein
MIIKHVAPSTPVMCLINIIFIYIFLHFYLFRKQ